MAKENLLGLKVDQARDLRWSLVGSEAIEHPLVEAYVKMLDALGLIGEAHRRGFHTIYLEEELYELCDEVHTAIWQQIGLGGTPPGVSGNG